MDTGEDDMPPVSSRRQKRAAHKREQKEAKKRKVMELALLPGADTITDAELAETTTFVENGRFC